MWCVSSWSTGSSHLVPNPKREFWRSTTLEIIQMFGPYAVVDAMTVKLRRVCSTIGMVVNICQLVSRSCVPLHTSCQHCVLGSPNSAMVRFFHSPATLFNRKCPIRSPHHLLVLTQRSLLHHRSQRILLVRFHQHLPWCLVRRLLFPSHLWLCFLLALQHTPALVDRSQKQDLHLFVGSIRAH